MDGIFNNFNPLVYFMIRYLVTSPQGPLTLYDEPHSVYNKNFLEKERADSVITPVIKQLLPNLTMVSGQEDAVQLARMLHAKYATIAQFFAAKSL